ncbi:MAG: hypothetical protein SLRJCFUN_001574 [Candidatus Fervidibacter sp.]
MSEASLKTFEGRKIREALAFAKVKRAFEQAGYLVAPLALNRSETFAEAERLFCIANDPPLLFMVLCLPDAFAFHPEKEVGYLLEVKAPKSGRQTVSIRLRDLWALRLWQALIVVVADEQIKAALAQELSSPECIIVPDEPPTAWDYGALEWARQVYPDARVLEGVAVEFGSKAPYGIWSLDAFASLDFYL